MDRDAAINQVRLDTMAGFKNAATATAEAGNQDSEEYRLASQNAIHMLNRALGCAVHLFLESKKRVYADLWAKTGLEANLS
jgi:hypothetical protein